MTIKEQKEETLDSAVSGGKGGGKNRVRHFLSNQHDI